MPKRKPRPKSCIAVLLAAMIGFEAVPYLEELLRGLVRANPSIFSAGTVALDTPPLPEKSENPHAARD